MVLSLFHRIFNRSRSQSFDTHVRCNRLGPGERKHCFSDEEKVSYEQCPPPLDDEFDVALLRQRSGSVLSHSSAGHSDWSQSGSKPKRTNGRRLTKKRYHSLQGRFGIDLSEDEYKYETSQILGELRAYLFRHQRLDSWAESWKAKHLLVHSDDFFKLLLSKDEVSMYLGFPEQKQKSLMRRRSAQGRALSTGTNLPIQYQIRRDQLIRRVLESVGKQEKQNAANDKEVTVQTKYEYESSFQPDDSSEYDWVRSYQETEREPSSNLEDDRFNSRQLASAQPGVGRLVQHEMKSELIIGSSTAIETVASEVVKTKPIHTGDTEQKPLERQEQTTQETWKDKKVQPKDELPQTPPLARSKGKLVPTAGLKKYVLSPGDGGFNHPDSPISKYEVERNQIFGSVPVLIPSGESRSRKESRRSITPLDSLSAYTGSHVSESNLWGHSHNPSRSSLKNEGPTDKVVKSQLSSMSRPKSETLPERMNKDRHVAKEFPKPPFKNMDSGVGTSPKSRTNVPPENRSLNRPKSVQSALTGYQSPQRQNTVETDDVHGVKAMKRHTSKPDSVSSVSKNERSLPLPRPRHLNIPEFGTKGNSEVQGSYVNKTLQTNEESKKTPRRYGLPPRAGVRIFTRSHLTHEVQKPSTTRAVSAGTTGFGSRRSPRSLPPRTTYMKQSGLCRIFSQNHCSAMGQFNSNNNNNNCNNDTVAQTRSRMRWPSSMTQQLMQKSKKNHRHWLERLTKHVQQNAKWFQANNGELDYQTISNIQPLLRVEDLKSYSLTPSTMSTHCPGRTKRQDDSSDTFKMSVSTEFLHSTSDENLAHKHRPRPGIAPGRTNNKKPLTKENVVVAATAVDEPVPHSTPVLKESEDQLESVALIEQQSSSLDGESMRDIVDETILPVFQDELSNDQIESQGVIQTPEPKPECIQQVTQIPVKLMDHKASDEKIRRYARRHRSRRRTSTSREHRTKIQKPPWNSSTRNEALQFYTVRPIESFLWPGGHNPNVSRRLRSHARSVFATDRANNIRSLKRIQYENLPGRYQKKKNRTTRLSQIRDGKEAERETSRSAVRRKQPNDSQGQWDNRQVNFSEFSKRKGRRGRSSSNIRSELRQNQSKSPARDCGYVSPFENKQNSRVPNLKSTVSKSFLNGPRAFRCRKKVGEGSRKPNLDKEQAKRVKSTDNRPRRCSRYKSTTSKHPGIPDTNRSHFETVQQDGKLVDFVAYISVIPSEIDELVLPFRACNKMHHIWSESKQLLTTLEREFARPKANNERTFETDSELNMNHDTKYPRGTSAKNKNERHVIKKRLFERIRNSFRKKPLRTNSICTVEENNHHRKVNIIPEELDPRPNPRLLAFWQHVLLHSNDSRLLRLIRELRRVKDRRVFAIEMRTNSRIQLKETKIYSVRGVPCMELRIRSDRTENLQRALTQLESDFPKLFKQIIFSERFCVPQGGHRYPNSKEFLLGGYTPLRHESRLSTICHKVPAVDGATRKSRRTGVTRRSKA
ncbi:hypothetical protein T265_09894 [Opisthorchis viverrini]|uniref:Uncharacterized protein n=1 Tax=Opisthorchis viverrini TaxID=6198 RepID=A0A075A3A8_OPIVI|nr:hypothetical protein T265_09894 [Opisthorchis viverrini]KER21889.1 hypothetical protein T265_09894 [Opisthorchis viverrini]